MKSFKKILSAVLAALMCAGTMGTAAMAEEIIDGNTWYGDEVAIDVTEGTEGYTYMSLFRKPISGYEFSGHFMGTEGPQTFVMIDTAEYGGKTWKPDGLYNPHTSNYDVVYCCDVGTMMVDGTYYKRMNLEDSEFYNEEQAAKIRAIVTNAYPYVTLEEMKANLARDNFAFANDLTRGEIIAAVQTAIWACANKTKLEYVKSYNVEDNYQWGQPVHDITSEDGLAVDGYRKFEVNTEVGVRINALADYLLQQEATYAEKAQKVINDLAIIGTPVSLNNGTYTIELELTLNNSGSGREDDLTISVYTGNFLEGHKKTTVPVVYGKDTYNIKVTTRKGDRIQAFVTGTQVLPRGVYYYAPKPADVNGDGEATSREVSQNLVGVAMGKTDVFEWDSVYFGDVSFQRGAVSDISYMYIDKETDEVDFAGKVYTGTRTTSAPIITDDSCVSVMFMNYSKSGMLWFSEEVDEETVEAAVRCLKKNNRSYRDHDEVVFGDGDYKLNYKKNKSVTYSFEIAD